MLVVVDLEMMEYYKNEDVIIYVFIIMNMVYMIIKLKIVICFYLFFIKDKGKVLIIFNCVFIIFICKIDKFMICD